MPGTVAGFLAGTATYAVLFSLATACVGHLRRPSELPAALRAHGVVPTPVPAAMAITAVEGLLGLVLLVGVLSGSRAGLVLGLAGATGVFAVYGGYGWYVMASGRGGPCGCGRVEVPMSGWVVGRTFTLAALSVVGLALSGSVPLLIEPGADLVVVLVAAATFATLLGHLPAAMHDPARRPEARRPEARR